MITVTVDNASGEDAPNPSSIKSWVEAALANRQDRAEVAVRIVDITESAALNRRYRGKTGPTNVLSFPAELPDFIESPLLGDLAICAQVVQREARQQNKPPTAHWAHMVIHGTLHLLGYDHDNKNDAIKMEHLEIEIMGSLNLPSPYLADAAPEHAAP